MLALILAFLTVFLPACDTEDDTMCYWNAATSGNGSGTSFISLTEDTILTF